MHSNNSYRPKHLNTKEKRWQHWRMNRELDQSGRQYPDGSAGDEDEPYEDSSDPVLSRMSTLVQQFNADPVRNNGNDYRNQQLERQREYRDLVKRRFGPYSFETLSRVTRASSDC